jgi:hypothetical protein
MPLTAAGDVTIVPLAGHTPGQIDAIVENGDHAVPLAKSLGIATGLLRRVRRRGTPPQHVSCPCPNRGGPSDSRVSERLEAMRSACAMDETRASGNRRCSLPLWSISRSLRDRSLVTAPAQMQESNGCPRHSGQS